MKINKLTIVLIIIIIGLISFIVFDEFMENKNIANNKDEKVIIKDTINLDYVTIYNKIKELKGGSN